MNISCVNQKCKIKYQNSICTKSFDNEEKPADPTSIWGKKLILSFNKDSEGYGWIYIKYFKQICT